MPSSTTPKPSKVLADLLAVYDDALAHLDDGRARLETKVETVSGWTPLQHIEHLGLANKTISRAIRLIESGRGEVEGEPSAMGALILRRGLIPKRRAKHPEAVAPRARPDVEGVRTLLIEGRGEFEVFEPQIDDLAERREKVPHFALGAFGALDWIRYAQVHTRHHLKIVKQILAKAAAR